VNKNLWSGSYVLLSGGLALIFFSFMFEIEQRVNLLHRFRLPLVFGRNAILIYLLAGLLARILIYTPWQNPGEDAVSLKKLIFTNFFTPLAEPELSSFLFAVVFTLLFYPLLNWMDRKGLYLRV
jgi:predicted acyltransferase